ncbi:MAG: hypothetical protein ABEJ34_03315 [Haloferacaceae archaeon]
MYPSQFLVPLGPLEAASPVVLYGLFVLALANMVTRFLAHRNHVAQVEGGAEDLDRYLPHLVSSLLLVAFSFAYMVIHPHGGMVASVLVLGTVVADFFEFEARQVEARNGMTIERPKSALTGSVLVLLYAAYQSIFFVIKPVWNSIV